LAAAAQLCDGRRCRGPRGRNGAVIYLRPKPGADPRGQASGKMIMIACGAAGAFIGALAKMLWERFC